MSDIKPFVLDFDLLSGFCKSGKVKPIQRHVSNMVSQFADEAAAKALVEGGDPTVQAVFKGIRPAVVALIAAPTFTVAKSSKINRFNVWIPILGALLIWAWGFSPIYVIVLAQIPEGYESFKRENIQSTDDKGNMIIISDNFYSFSSRPEINYFFIDLKYDTEKKEHVSAFLFEVSRKYLSTISSTTIRPVYSWGKK